MYNNHKTIKVIHFAVSVLPIIFLCSCMVNGQVVLRPGAIIAKASGRTEEQVEIAEILKMVMGKVTRGMSLSPFEFPLFTD